MLVDSASENSTVAPQKQQSALVRGARGGVLLAIEKALHAALTSDYRVVVIPGSTPATGCPK